MKSTLILPVAMLALSVAAALTYLSAGDVRRAIYWAAAAVITASVTF